MKKIFAKLSLSLILALSLSSACLAVDVNQLLPKIGANSGLGNEYKETTYVKNLPDVTYQSAIATAIKTILQMAMSLTIIALVIASIYYIISRGQEEDITKAKDIILYLVIGMAIIAGAYGIVAGITEFEFFK